ncbi:type II toxin-antitoxin system RelE/ParE family toxin [Nitratifractor sp.]
MIVDFKCSETHKIFERQYSKKLPSDIQRVIYRKLVMLDAAKTLEDLRVPPSNRLEKLAGDRSGQYSIRINRQYRICFVWEGGNAYQVEVIDYH